MFTIRFVERPVGEPARQQKCPIYRCLACGRTFADVEAGEDVDPEEDSEPPFI